MMAENNLLLIRHSLPEVRPDISSPHWTLTETGRQRCVALADKLRTYDLGLVVTSTERKALQTGEIVGQLLGIPRITSVGLQEYARKDMGLVSQEDFEAKQKRFFNEPSAHVLGEETAQQALQRFSAALAQVLENHPSVNVAIVSHGIVIALWLAGLIGGDPFIFWKRLGMPSFAVFSRPVLEFMELVEYVG